MALRFVRHVHEDEDEDEDGDCGGWGCWRRREGTEMRAEVRERMVRERRLRRVGFSLGKEEERERKMGGKRKLTAILCRRGVWGRRLDGWRGRIACFVGRRSRSLFRFDCRAWVRLGKGLAEKGSLYNNHTPSTMSRTA